MRRAVYESAGGGWRLAAHARVAAALEGAWRRAGPARPPRPVLRRARGREAAIALLRAAGDAVRPQTPASAARWYEAALRLLPGPTPNAGAACSRNWPAPSPRPGAWRRAGARCWRRSRCAPDRGTPSTPPGRRLRRHGALARPPRGGPRRLLLARALNEVGDSPVLWLELAFDALYGLDLETSAARAEQALEHADRLNTASAAALLSLVRAAGGRREQAERALDAALAETALAHELAERLEALWYLAWSETFLDRYDAALEHARRGMELSRATGQDRLIVPLTLSFVFPLEMPGRIAEARDAARRPSTRRA